MMQLLILWSQVWTRHKDFEILVYNMVQERYIACISPVHPRKGRECLQNLLTESTTCFMHACLAPSSSSSGTGSPWSPALLSCRGGSAVSSPVFWKPAKISTGYAKYMTNLKPEKRYYSYAWDILLSFCYI